MKHRNDVQKALESTAMTHIHSKGISCHKAHASAPWEEGRCSRHQSANAILRGDTGWKLKDRQWLQTETPENKRGGGNKKFSLAEYAMCRVRQPVYFDNHWKYQRGEKDTSKVLYLLHPLSHVRMMLLFCKRGKNVLKNWINFFIFLNWASLIAQLVKNPPAMQETPVQFLGWEDPLEKG